MTLIYFSAPWCTPCKAIEPKVAQAVEDKGLNVTYVNIAEVDRGVVHDFDIVGVPTLLEVDASGSVIQRESGARILRML